MFDMTLFLKDLRGRCLMLSSRLFQTFTAAKRKLNLQHCDINHILGQKPNKMMMMMMMMIITVIIIGTVLIIKLRLSFQWQRCLRKP